jgi:D-glycero-D-manno-heptose 1,7-bisphosphate phosphatase
LKAFFLDRDGVINIDTGYVYKIEDFVFENCIFDALKFIQEKGFDIYIITNQSGISRGLFAESDFLKLTNWMLAEFEKNDIKIKSVEFCPHLPNDNCCCRKPNTGLLERLTTNFNIDLYNSWIVGDKFSDIELAVNANIPNAIFIGKPALLDNKKVPINLKVMSQLSEITKLDFIW